jgi:hypothetical protein
MKRGILFAAALLMCASVQAQTATEGSTNTSALIPTQPISNSVLTQDTRVKITESIGGKEMQVSGPLVQPLQSPRLGDVPRRIGDLFNPFAKTEPARQIERDSGVSARAWTEVVGWNPGASAFPDASTHEPSMQLLVITRPKER